jgi:hypothetical protein
VAPDAESKTLIDAYQKNKTAEIVEEAKQSS